MAYSVRGAIACTRLSLEAERLSLGPPDLQLPAQLQWNPEGYCSGQLFAVVVMGGAATPKGVFAALTPIAGALAERQQCAVQAPGEHQGIARARNHTCSELSSVLSTRTRAAPLSVAETTSVGSSRSWSGAIVTPPHARGVVFHVTPQKEEPRCLQSYDTDP
eukprot:scaffold4502_cov119-Isochrysis_galbana.AAC.13